MKAKWQTGVVAEWRNLTPSLATFRLLPEAETRFSAYEAGQYIALTRSRCRLTKRIVDASGSAQYVPELDEAGRQRYGPVTHSYSIASAPFETSVYNYLEFYIVLETDVHGAPGRLSSSLFEMAVTGDRALSYFHEMAGTFTLRKRVEGRESVLMIGTGTGVAPFVSMVKHLNREAETHVMPDVRYTLIHANRTRPELAYHDELLAIEAARRFDFLYIPLVSRPTSADVPNPRLGRGRANNLLRYIFGMPLKESTTEPALPGHIRKDALLQRINRPDAVLLTCGNPLSVADIRSIAAAQRLRVETEEW